MKKKMRKNKTKRGKGKTNSKTKNIGIPVLYDSYKAKIVLVREGLIVCYPSRNCYDEISAVLKDSDLMQIVAAYSVDKVIFKGSRDNFFNPVGACNSPFCKEKGVRGCLNQK